MSYDSASSVNDLVLQHDPYPPPKGEANLFVERPPDVDPDWYCRAVARIPRGENAGKFKYCYARAGAGTPHKGWGRCYQHGGGKPEDVDRFNALTNPTLHELLDQYLDDPDPMNLHQELAVARAIVQYEITQHQEASEALLAWHASFDKNRRGLHDHPLYHVHAIKKAFELGLIHDGQTPEELQEALEFGLAQWQQEWKLQENGRSINLRVERPVKATNYLALLKGLTVIASLVKDITKLEEEAYLSAFAVEQALQRYGQITREAIMALLREKGISVDEAQKVITVVAKKWDKVPLAESSVPRISAASPRRKK